jgi:hypothetical protein
MTTRVLEGKIVIDIWERGDPAVLIQDDDAPGVVLCNGIPHTTLYFDYFFRRYAGKRIRVTIEEFP